MRITNQLKRGSVLMKENYAFILVILSISISLLLIVFLTFGSYYHDANEKAVTIGDMTVTQEARRIEDSMSTYVNALLLGSYTVDNMLEHGASTKSINHYLVQETQGFIKGVNPDFSGIYGVVNDKYVDGIGWVPEKGYTPYKRPWYIAAAEKKGELAIVTPYQDAQTGDTMLSLSKLLSDGKSAISLDVRLDNIYEITETIQLAGNGYCFLTDSNGNVIAHRDESQIGKNYMTDSAYEQTDERRMMEKVLDSSVNGTFQSIDLDGHETMVFTQSVMNELNVILVVESADVFHNTRLSLVYSICASLFILLVVGYFCTSNFINRKRAIRYAENIRIDKLTGLNNRGEFDRYLLDMVGNMSIDNKLYLLLFDSDEFKQINDTFGHPEGDRALCLIAKVLMSVCHGKDCFCARYGGDEFVIICKCNDESCAKRIIQEVADELETVTSENNLPYQLSLSCGYACYTSNVRSITDLIDIADKNLYGVKEKKKKTSQ